MNEPWRLNLVLGDQVDALIMIQSNNKPIEAWAQGKITKISEGQDTLVVQMCQIADLNGVGQLTGKSLEVSGKRWSIRIAKFESKTKIDYNWRNNHLVRAGTLVDANDFRDWIESTVLETKVQDGIRIAKIGYRVYRTQGERLRTDAVSGKSYIGWSTIYDEWISIYSPRIQPHLSKAQRQVICKKSLADRHAKNQLSRLKIEQA